MMLELTIHEMQEVQMREIFFLYLFYLCTLKKAHCDRNSLLLAKCLHQYNYSNIQFTVFVLLCQS